MQRGFYWIAQLPKGQYALLYADPVMKAVHTQVAVFSTHLDAIRHCRKNRITLATLENQSPKAPKKLGDEELPRLQKMVYVALLGLCDERGIAKITHSELQEACGMTHRPNMVATLNSLMRKGLVARLESGWGEEPYTYQLYSRQQKKPPPEGSGEAEGPDQETTKLAVRFRDS